MLSALDLADKFRGCGLVEKRKKCTNIPKFIFKIALNLKEQEEIGTRYRRWLISLRRKYNVDQKRDGDRHAQSCSKASRFSLLELLQGSPYDSAERRAWKQQHRELLQLELASRRYELILDNSSIPPFNKVHYLYCCRVFEWRLNNPLLLEHLS